MTKKEVIDEIGEENWEEFCEWMTGQTIGGTYDNPDYYECDVKKFKSILKEKGGKQ